MKEIKVDVIIVGGGLTGILTAYVLGLLKLKILLIDSGKNVFNSNPVDDFRTTAISEGSKIFFQKINFWKSIKNHCNNIKTIRVFDRLSTNKINFLFTTTFPDISILYVFFVVSMGDFKKEHIPMNFPKQDSLKDAPKLQK